MFVSNFDWFDHNSFSNKWGNYMLILKNIVENFLVAVKIKGEADAIAGSTIQLVDKILESDDPGDLLAQLVKDSANNTFDVKSRLHGYGLQQVT